MKFKEITTKQYGVFRCTRCGDTLNGYCVAVAKQDDIEGKEWRTFHNNCYKYTLEACKMRNITKKQEVLTFIYNRYDASPLVREEE